MLPLLVTAAIVVEDQIFLRTAPEERAPHPVLLYKGDWLEVRGETRGYLQVYDHRHERAGYVVPERVRKYPLEPESSPSLRAIVEFLRDTRGAESLGIAYAALYLRTAPPQAIDAAIFDALGTMADRLARRVSAASGAGADPALPAHLEVAASYGVRFRALEKQGRTETCYDGEAFRRVLALGGSAIERARAALALTDPRCRDAALVPSEAEALAEWEAKILEELDPAAAEPAQANRVRMRSAVVHALLAHQRARRKDAAGARSAIERGIAELARVDKAQLGAAEETAYQESAIQVAASRWALEEMPPLPAGVELAEGKPGETCLRFMGEREPFERCTYGVLWAASIRATPSGDRLAVAVSPLPGWVELWLFSRAAKTWKTETLIPAVTAPELGYVELAGFLPGGKKALIVREAKLDTGLAREFQIVDTDTAAVEKRAHTMSGLGPFRRHHSADWKRGTLALR